MDLQGRVAVVTGASRGIGKATAIVFGQAGATVVLAARSTRDAAAKLPGTLEETASAVEAAGGRPVLIPTDLKDEAQVEAMTRRVLDELGRVDVLVNNAAVAVMAPFLEVPMRRWDLMFDVNLRASAMCAQAFLPRMLEQGSGAVVNISSYVGDRFQDGMLAYGVSKKALEAFTIGLAHEMRDKPVAVNCLKIEQDIASEGWMFNNTARDETSWQPPELAARCLVWLATRPPTYSGNVVTIAEVQAQMEHRVIGTR